MSPESDSDSLLVRYRYAFLLAAGLLLYVPFLGLRDMWYPDEPDVAEVCRAMFLSGDWIAPRRMGVIWVDYPPMLYWAGTVFSHVFGRASEFALRLPNALTAVATVLVTCVAGTRWYGARAGLWAGFALLTGLQFTYQSVSYRPDVLFTLWIAVGILTYAAGCGDGRRGWLRVLGFAMLGLAMLAKGPLGLLLPGLVLVLWHGSRREWRRILELAPLSLVSLAIYLPWFVACARAMGADSILHELYAQNFARFFAGARGHEQPFYYFLTGFWFDWLPWSPLVPFCLVWIRRAAVRRDPNMQLALWWFGTFCVFLTVAVTKRELYLLPAYPAVALLLAPWLARLGAPGEGAPSPRVARNWAGLLALGTIVLGLAAAGTAFATDAILARGSFNPLDVEVAHALYWPLLLFAAALLAVGLWVGQAARRGGAATATLRVGLGQLVLYAVFLGAVMPAFGPTKTYKPQSEWIKQRIGDGTHFGMVYPAMAFRKMGAFGYYTGALAVLMESREEVERFFRDYPGSVVLVHDASFPVIFAGDEARWSARVERELRTGSHLYLVVGGPGPGPLQ